MLSLKMILMGTAAALIAGGGLALHAQDTSPHIASPQRPGVSRTDLLRDDLSFAGREAIQVRVDFGRGAGAPRHSHPGEEIAYVLKGALEYRLDGRPPITLRGGQSLFIPAGTIHSARNVGTGSASELATYIVEKGKPLVTLAP
jgi:quercetin dioxygenase-like cupin family protein